VIGRIFERRPVRAFLVGVASHLVLDMVPHWGCTLTSEGGRRLFLRYAQRDGVLCLLIGAGALAAVDRRARPATLAAMAGAVLLDVDKPLVHFFRWNPFPRVVRRIHARAQNESPRGMPNEVRFGVCCAAVDVAVMGIGRNRDARIHEP
jgi:hypothetical protein